MKGSDSTFSLKLGAFVLPVFFLWSCSKETSPTIPLNDLARKGRSVYLANCIACHNPDPTKTGSIGPDIAGSSLELLQERVLKRAYPTGYTPKRTSQQMPAFPQLEKDLPAIAEYLQSFKR